MLMAGKKLLAAGIGFKYMPKQKKGGKSDENGKSMERCLWIEFYVSESGGD